MYTDGVLSRATRLGYQYGCPTSIPSERKLPVDPNGECETPVDVCTSSCSGLSRSSSCGYWTEHEGGIGLAYRLQYCAHRPIPGAVHGGRSRRTKHRSQLRLCR